MKTDESKSDDDSKANFLSDFVENIRESLGVEPSTSSAEPEDDSNMESALGDRLNQDQVTGLSLHSLNNMPSTTKLLNNLTKNPDKDCF
jgi:hypothetical protein